MILRGLRFGMMLQLAVGPLCFLTLRTAAQAGVGAGLLVAVAVALADALFVTLSAIGVARLLQTQKVKKLVQLAGGMVLCMFGLNILLSAFGMHILPDIQLFGSGTGGYFWQGFFLTVSNPLTVIFWGGVFTAQIAQHQYQKHQLALFAAGCVLSTLLSLALVAFLGSMAASFLSETAVQVLNALVGAVLIGYGFKLMLQNDRCSVQEGQH